MENMYVLIDLEDSTPLAIIDGSDDVKYKVQRALSKERGWRMGEFEIINFELPLKAGQSVEFIAKVWDWGVQNSFSTVKLEVY